MSTTIRKVLISAYGDVDNVSVVSAEIPAPAANEVQVKVIYSGFSGADINMRLGRYPMQKAAPLTPGYCFTGRVHANGPRCSKFKAGDLVTAITMYDSEAELVNVPEKSLVAVPEGLDLQQVTALTLDWNTAYGMVNHAAKVSKGQRVFIHGMSGSVGYATLVLCQLQGAVVYGTASERNHAALQKLGATPFVYTNKDWMTAMRELGGAHVVFDPLGYESWDESYSILCDKEHSVLVGFGQNLATLNGEAERSPMITVFKLLLRNITFCPYKKTVFYYIKPKSKQFEPDLRALLDALAAGTISPAIKGVWDMENIKEAHQSWSKASGIGAMVIRVAKDL